MSEPNPFHQVIDRRQSHAKKWLKFGPQVLPFWVADMDFAAPDFILDAMRERLDHPILGYTQRPDSLNEALREWLEYHFDWAIPDEWIVWIPGVVPGMNLAAQTLPAKSGIIIPTPVYHPFFDIADDAGLNEHRVACVPNATSKIWEFDWDAMQAAVDSNTRMLAICNPQNPTGRCYSKDELNDVADFVAKHKLLLASDEIHANIVLDETMTHEPIVKLRPDIADQTITLIAASKTYNIPGLSCAAAIIPNPQLRKQFLDARRGLIPGIGPLGFAAAEAAYRDRGPWLPGLLNQLRENYAQMQAVLGDRLSPLQATYLAWIRVDDVLAAHDVPATIQGVEDYFVSHGLGISPGVQFDDAAYIRFNFGCPPSTLNAGLERLLEALNAP